MLTLAEMQHTPDSDLMRIALHAPNRQYARACTQMAYAMRAHAVGDVEMRTKHIEAAKTAHLRAQEDEHGQCLHVRRTAAVIGAKDVEEVSGLSTHLGMHETHYSNGRKRGEAAVK